MKKAEKERECAYVADNGLGSLFLGTVYVSAAEVVTAWQQIVSAGAFIILIMVSHSFCRDTVGIDYDIIVLYHCFLTSKTS